MGRGVWAVAIAAGIGVMAIQPEAASPASDLADHGHWKRLRALLEPRVAANANDAEAQWLMSRVRLAYRDADGALPPAEKAVALDPRNAEYRWQLAQVVGELASSASVFKQMGLAKRFKREAEAVLAIDPKHTGAMVGLMEFYYRAPGLVGGDKKKATAIVDQILAINKVDGYIAKVRLMGRTEPPATPAQVEQVWVQAVQADPSRYEPHGTLASIYASGTPPRWDLAEKEALIAKKIDPDRSGPYSILASAYISGDRWAELDAILAESEKVIPDNLTPYLRCRDDADDGRQGFAACRALRAKVPDAIARADVAVPSDRSLAPRASAREAGPPRRRRRRTPGGREARPEVRAGPTGSEAVEALSDRRSRGSGEDFFNTELTSLIRGGRGDRRE